MTAADVEALAERYLDAERTFEQAKIDLTVALREPYLRAWFAYLGNYRMRQGSRYWDRFKSYISVPDSEMLEVDDWVLESVSVDFFLQHETFPLTGGGLRLPRGFVQDMDAWIAEDQKDATLRLKENRMRLVRLRTSLLAQRDSAAQRLEPVEQEIAEIDAQIEDMP